MPTITTRGAMSARGFGFGYKSAGVAAGSQSYTTPGAFTWVAPAGVTRVSVVTVGAGSQYNNGSCGATNGGALSYKNNITVTPGASYTVYVSGTSSAACTTKSYFCSPSLVSAGNGWNRTSRTGDGGGNGGLGGCSGRCCTYYGGGGGAGGYSGTGGAGACGSNPAGQAGAACSGAGGGGGSFAGGGGVGLNGKGTTGSGGANGVGGGAGSGGAAGQSCAGGHRGGNYGGGSGHCAASYPTNGAVRVVWPGCSRQFPSTCVGAP